MIENTTFRITYKKSNGESVTRFGKWDRNADIGNQQKRTKLCTYFDWDKQGYRTAKDK